MVETSLELIRDIEIIARFCALASSHIRIDTYCTLSRTDFGEPKSYGLQVRRKDKDHEVMNMQPTEYYEDAYGTYLGHYEDKYIVAVSKLFSLGGLCGEVNPADFHGLVCYATLEELKRVWELD